MIILLLRNPRSLCGTYGNASVNNCIQMPLTQTYLNTQKHPWKDMQILVCKVIQKHKCKGGQFSTPCCLLEVVASRFSCKVTFLGFLVHVFCSSKM